jgi:hypothetical protein
MPGSVVSGDDPSAPTPPDSGSSSDSSSGTSGQSGDPTSGDTTGGGTSTDPTSSTPGDSGTDDSGLPDTSNWTSHDLDAWAGFDDPQNSLGTSGGDSGGSGSGQSSAPDISSPPVLPDEAAQDLSVAATAGPATGGTSGSGGSGGGSNTGGNTGTGQNNVPAVPSAQITAGGYQRHYVQTGENSSVKFSLDVTVNSTFATAPAASGGTTSSESGTVDYTATLLSTDDTVLMTDVGEGSFTSPLSSASNFAFFGLPPGGGPVSGYAPADFGFNSYTWDHQHWTDSLTFSATGNYAASNGATYQFSSQYTGTNWWDSTRTWAAAGAEEPAGAGTETYANTYGGNYRSDLTQSDQAANFPADTQYDENGYPTNLLQAPAAGTNYLERSFDTQAYEGNSQSTYHWDGESDWTDAAFTNSSTYDGLNGYRYYFNGSAKVGDRTSVADPTEDNYTWNIDYKQAGTYGGSRSSSLTADSPLDASLNNYSGTVAATSNSEGDVFANEYSLKDSYHRDDGTTRLDGTYRYDTGNNGQIATYDNAETTQRTYNSGALNADQFTYLYANTGDSKVTASNAYNYAQTVNGSGETRVGQNSGMGYDWSSYTSHSESVNSGTADRLAKTGSIDVSGDYNGSGASLSVSSGGYAADDGSYTGTSTSISSGSGTYSGDSSAKGNYNSDHLQTDGYSHDHSESDGTGSGMVWSKVVGNAKPTWTSQYTVSQQSSDDGTTDLSYNPDGTANGKIQATSGVTGDDTTNTTLIGTQTLYNATAGTTGAAAAVLTGTMGLGGWGSGLGGAVTIGATDAMPVGSTVYNDSGKTTDHFENQTTVDLALQANVSTGDIVTKSTNHQVPNLVVDHKTDYDDDSQHSQLNGNTSGTIDTSDTVTTLLANGVPTTTDVFVLQQNITGAQMLTANGKLSDGNGHTGTWNGNSTATSTVNDQVTLNRAPSALGGWVLTGQTFSVNHTDQTAAEYHESDNGVFAVPTIGLGTSTQVHTQDAASTSSRTWIAEGTPAVFDFTLKSSGKSDFKDYASFTGANSVGDTWGGTSSSVQHRDYVGNYVGVNVNGSLQYTSIYTNINASQNDRSDRWLSTQNSRTDSHNWRTLTLFENTAGNTWSGTGVRIVNCNSATWGNYYDRASDTTTSMGNPNPPANPAVQTDLSWPTPWKGQPTFTTWSVLRADLLGDPTVQRLAANGVEIARIAGGLFDLGAGAYMTVQTGGLAAVPGVALMGVGFDQIVTGSLNIYNNWYQPGARRNSYLERAGSTLALAAGIGPKSASVIGDLTPAALSLGFGGWGTAVARGGFAAAGVRGGFAATGFLGGSGKFPVGSASGLLMQLYRGEVESVGFIMKLSIHNSLAWLGSLGRLPWITRSQIRAAIIWDVDYFRVGQSTVHRIFRFRGPHEYLFGGKESLGLGYFNRSIAQHELLHVGQYIRNPQIIDYGWVGIFHEIIPSFVGTPLIYGIPTAGFAAFIYAQGSSLGFW